MLTIYDICKQIAKDTNRDYDEIYHIARYEFAITKNKLTNDKVYVLIISENLIFQIKPLKRR